MLPKCHRLTRSRDFVRVRRFGRKAGSPVLALYVLRTRPPDIRVGFSVSKKVGKATIRNQVKRRLREVVRHQLPTIRPGQDLVFVAQPASASAAYADIADAVEYLLRKSGAALQAARTTHNA